MIKTADELLDKLARQGGVIVGTNMLSSYGITLAAACDRMYVNEYNLGFVLLPNCYAEVNPASNKETSGDIT